MGPVSVGLGFALPPVNVNIVSVFNYIDLEILW